MSNRFTNGIESGMMLAYYWEEFKMSKISEKLGGKKHARRLKLATSCRGIRPEVQVLIDKLREGVNLSHEARLTILFELINAGWSDREVLEVFNHAPQLQSSESAILH